jgi:hypothetical protein
MPPPRARLLHSSAAARGASVAPPPADGGADMATPPPVLAAPEGASLRNVTGSPSSSRSIIANPASTIAADPPPSSTLSTRRIINALSRCNLPTQTRQPPPLPHSTSVAALVRLGRLGEQPEAGAGDGSATAARNIAAQSARNLVLAPPGVVAALARARAPLAATAAAAHAEGPASSLLRQLSARGSSARFGAGVLPPPLPPSVPSGGAELVQAAAMRQLSRLASARTLDGYTHAGEDA